MAKQIRIGVIGLGIGGGHADHFKKLADCEVTALADLNPDRLKTVGERLGITARYAEAGDMLEREPLDAVVIATPNKFHAPLTLAALKRGLHVFCEKPMAMSVAEATAMKAAAAKGREIRFR
jgi:predicted dehydrogenase